MDRDQESLEPLSCCHILPSTHLDLLQKQVGLHKAVVHEATWPTTVLQELGRVGSQFGIGTDQLTVMRDQGLGNLEVKEREVARKGQLP